MARTTRTGSSAKRCVAYRHRRCGDVSAVRIDVEERYFIIVCGCGWRGDPAEHVRDAVETWQDHRDNLR